MHAASAPGFRGTLAWLARGIVVVTAALFLTSPVGAAIIAAPITLPLLSLVALLSPERGWRVAATLVGGLTGVEVGLVVAAWVPLKHGVGSWVAGVGSGVLVGVGLWKSRGLMNRMPARSDRWSAPVT